MENTTITANSMNEDCLAYDTNSVDGVDGTGCQDDKLSPDAVRLTECMRPIARYSQYSQLSQSQSQSQQFLNPPPTGYQLSWSQSVEVNHPRGGGNTTNENSSSNNSGHPSNSTPTATRKQQHSQGPPDKSDDEASLLPTPMSPTLFSQCSLARPDRHRGTPPCSGGGEDRGSDESPHDDQPLQPHSPLRQGPPSSPLRRPSPLHFRKNVRSIQDPLSQTAECSEPEPSSTQLTEILTQNADLTQLGDDDDDDAELAALSPLQCLSPVRQEPWGRLMPCSEAGRIVYLYPRPIVPPGGTAANKNRTTKHKNENYDRGKLANAVVDPNRVQPGDTWNEYVIGRSTKCDILALKPENLMDENNNSLQLKKTQARNEWAYGMISNRHCKLYCTVSSVASASGYQVNIQDCSANGTLINQTTLLRKGESRVLHSGDEVCLVNRPTLQKKVRSTSELAALLQQHSYIFVQCRTATTRTTQDTPPLTAKHANDRASNSKPTESLLEAVTKRQPQGRTTPVENKAGAPTPSSSQRKAAVDVRSTKSWDAPPNGRRLVVPQPPATKQQQLAPHRRIQEDYDIRDVLGTGTVGEVRRAIHRTTGIQYAVKILHVARQRGRTVAELQSEASMLKQLQHPYVVPFVDVFTSSTAVYLIMELMPGGDLFDRIVSKDHYSETDARRVARRLLAAVHYLHETQNIVHRDLKPENILLKNYQSDIEIKLTDFGLAKTDCDLKTFCGTPAYFAPEVLRRRHTVKGVGRYGKPADMWSVGVILYVLLTGAQPFDDEMNAPLEFPDFVPSEARDLVSHLLQQDPALRATVVCACNHPWILSKDGDTHIHPLDDPQLGSAGQTETSREVAVSAFRIKDTAKDDDVENTDCLQRLNENCGDAIYKSLHTEKGLPAEIGKRQTEGMPRDIDKPQSNTENKADEATNCGTGTKGTVGGRKSATNFTFRKSKSAAKKSTAVSGHTNVRAPLSPVSLNEEKSKSKTETEVPAAGTGSLFQPQRLLSVPHVNGNDESELSTTPSTKAQVGEAAQNAITPAMSNARVSLAGSDAAITMGFGTEKLNSEDEEVISKFSDQSDSILSFETVTSETENGKSDTSDSTDLDKATSNGVFLLKSQSVAISKSRRRRDNPEPNGCVVNEKRDRTAVSPAVSKRKRKDKQTTLKNWFKKQKQK